MTDEEKGPWVVKDVNRPFELEEWVEGYWRDREKAQRYADNHNTALLARINASGKRDRTAWQRRWDRNKFLIDNAWEAQGYQPGPRPPDWVELTELDEFANRMVVQPIEFMDD